ncbi:MAG: putative bifunctional diguanylate cyclase/phosphodiesterase [Thiotrichales bacterium]
MQDIRQPLVQGFSVVAVLMALEAFFIQSAPWFDVFDQTAILQLSVIPVLLAVWVGIRALRNTQAKVDLLESEIQQARDSEQELRWHATHDSLTRLINRHEFKKRIKHLCAQASLDGSEHVVMFLDLDKFKTVNDTCGHNAGDELLRQLSRQFSQCLSPKHTVARIGGDEFGVLLPATSLQSGLHIAQCLTQEAREFQFFWHGRLFEIGVSIGLAVIDRDTHSHYEALNAADKACYMAKEAGRNQVRVLNASSEELAEFRQDAHIAQEIPKAIRANRLELHAQEIRCVNRQEQNPRGKHYELLVRMRRESGEVVEPGRFIPVAENYGLASDIDRWVVSHALEWMETSRCALKECAASQEFGLCEFSINLSGQSVSDPQFLKDVLHMLDTSHVDPRRITFEITETAVISNLELAKELITQLKALGCRFSLDDFGSGMSSFGYLQELDVDYVKIDGSLVQKLAWGGLENAMVDAIIHVARHKKALTVAEFVEDDLTINLLRNAGIDFVQGYVVHRPALLQTLGGCAVKPDQHEVQLKLAV